MDGNRSTTKAFYSWVKQLKIKDVQTFRRADEKFFKSLPRRWEESLKKKIGELDMSVLLEHRKRCCNIRTEKKLKEKMKALPNIELLDKTKMAVELAISGSSCASQIRFVSDEGIRKVVGICLASGYSYDETAKFFNIPKADVELLVSPEEVKKLVREVSDAVIMMADQKVARDLMSGTITKETVAADSISARRKKLVIEAVKEKRNVAESQVRQTEHREKHIFESFGEKKGLE